MTKSASQRVNDPVAYLRDQISQDGLESIGRFYGVYEGIVVDNQDPEERGRCRIMLPILNMFEPPDVPDDFWALPSNTGLSVGESGIHGFYYPADVGDQVFVMFKRGKSSSPVYFGGSIPKGTHTGTELTSKNAKAKGIRTASGHYLRMNDEDGGITIAHGDGNGGVSGAMVSITGDGEVVISNSNGAVVYLSSSGEMNLVNSDGTTVGMSDGGVKLISKGGAVVSVAEKNVSIIAGGNITLKSGGKITLDAASVDIGPSSGLYEPAIKGNEFTNTYLTHQHTTTSPGAPTAPGVIIPPAPGVGLSLGVRIS
jgi:hypothetical protein